MPGWLVWLIGFVLKGLGLGPKEGPSPEAVAEKEAGKAQEDAAVSQQSAQAATAVAQAEAEAPKTQTDVANAWKQDKV